MNQQKELSPQGHTQRYKSYAHLLSFTINITLSSFFFGYSTGYFNSIKFDDIVDIYRIEGKSLSVIQGTLTGIIFLTGSLGAYFSSHLLTRFGRKQSLIITSFIAILSCLISLFPNLTIFYLARCLQGIVVGVGSVLVPIYIKQISPTELAGSLCPWFAISFMVGLTSSFTLTFLCSLIMDVHTYWRLVYGFPIVCLIYQIYQLKVKYPFDTPKCLILQGRIQEARQLLSIIYFQEFVDDVFDDIKKGLLLQNNSRVSQISKVTEQDLPDMHHIHLQTNQSEISTRLLEVQMVALKNRKNFQTDKIMEVDKVLETNPLAKITAIHVSIAQHGSASMPIISYSSQTVGILFPLIQKVFPIALSLGSLGASFFCLFLLHRYGRKDILVKSPFIIGATLIILSYCLFMYNSSAHNNLLLKLTICLCFFCVRAISTCTTGSIGSIYISQTVQSSFMALTMMTNWIMGALTSILFPILSDSLGGDPSLIFMGFGVYMFIVGVINHYLLVETKDKEEYQINAEIEQKLKCIKNKWELCKNK